MFRFRLLRNSGEIVAEIEKQFTRLEAGVAALRRVQANLKRYRAAVLKAACEGRLVPTEAELAKKVKKVEQASPPAYAEKRSTPHWVDQVPPETAACRPEVYSTFLCPI